MPPLTFLHGPDRVAVDAAGRALDGSGYAAFFGIAPAAVCAATATAQSLGDEGSATDPLGWNRAAHLIGLDPVTASKPGQDGAVPDPLAQLVADQGVLSFAESVAIAESFLADHQDRCLAGAQANELWAVKEGWAASVWCATGGGQRIALNIARDRMAAQELAASAPRLSAAAAALGSSAVAEPVAQAWMDGHFVLAQRWIEDSHELGIYRDRASGTSVLTRVARFLTGGVHPVGLTGVQGWPLRGEEAWALIQQIAGLALGAAASGVSAGLGHTALTVGQGDLVMTGAGCVIVACDGSSLAAERPDAKTLAAALLADLRVDDALTAAFVAALEDRIAAHRVADGVALIDTG